MTGPASPHRLRSRSTHLLLLVLLAIAWGINWPITKVGVSAYPPMAFRAACVLLALPVLGVAMRQAGVSLAVPRAERLEVLKVAMANMVVWNLLLITALPHIASGRCAVLAYTMPLFSAAWGVLRGRTLGRLQLAGLAAGAAAIALLLVDEAGALGGSPGAVVLVLAGACVWGLGSQWIADGRIRIPTLTLTFWSTALTGLVLALVAALDPSRPQWPSPAVTWAIAYNAVLIFGLSQALWFYLARHVPVTVFTLSTLLVPLVGTSAGAVMLGERIGATELVSLVLILVAVAAGHLGQEQERAGS